jgi:hypothetical protein
MSNREVKTRLINFNLINMSVIVGTIKRIEATKERGANNFKTRDLIVVTEEQYPQTLCVQFSQDKTTLLDNFTANQKVKVEYSLRGREVIKEGQEPAVYNSINGWKIEKVV